MKAIDILNGESLNGKKEFKLHADSGIANNPLDSITLDIGRRLNNGMAPHSVQPAMDAKSYKMSHTDETVCPKCHKAMEIAKIGDEEVYFCSKHAVTMPKSEE